MGDDWETKSNASAGNMSTFEKLLHKDNKKLNRLQKEAKHYIETTGAWEDCKAKTGFNPEGGEGEVRPDSMEERPQYCQVVRAAREQGQAQVH